MKVASLGVLGIALLLVGPLDRTSSEVTAALVREADQRKELTPEQFSEIGYWHRHERNQAACRGQTYIATCCDSSFDTDTLTCLNAKEIR